MNSKTTLLKKIILLFIVLIIPLILLSIFALKQSNNLLRKQVLSSIDSNNSTYISQLDNTLFNIYAANYNLINQSSFQKFSTYHSPQSSYERSQQINSLREQLSGSRITSPFVESSHVFFKDLNIAYNSVGFKLGSFSTLTKEELNLFDNLARQQGPLHYYENPITKNWELTYILLPYADAKYGACFVISQTELKNYLDSNRTYEKEHYLFTTNSDFILSDFESKDLDNVRSTQKEWSKKLLYSDYELITLNGVDYYGFYYEMPHSSGTYMRFIPTSSLLKNINTSPMVLAAFFLLLSLSCMVFFIGVYRMIHKPLVQLTDAFTEVKQGNFEVKITDYNSPDFLYLYHAFNDMTQKLDMLIEKNYNQKFLLQKAELKQLQAQINPHFLYNSFFMLQRMIKTELMEESQEMANALGMHFKYLTRNSMDHVTLLEEYDYAKTYAYIQGLRFEGRIQIDFEELPPKFHNLPVPKLILQPILENAFNYGLSNKVKNGLIQVLFSQTDDILTIKIQDNGEELTEEKLNLLSEKLEVAKESSSGNEMTGILNIQRRLVIFSGSLHALHVSRSVLGGLCVSMNLKYKLEESPPHIHSAEK